MFNRKITAALLLVTLALLPACSPRENVATETISPATPPAGATDTDAVTTQTTEIGDERSPNEGGILTDTSKGGVAVEPPTSTNTVTATPTATATQPR